MHIISHNRQKQTESCVNSPVSDKRCIAFQFIANDEKILKLNIFQKDSQKLKWFKGKRAFKQ